MRVTIDPTQGRTLNLLGEIPDLHPCLIEGRNGIGKTLTIRLLQLISGDQPFENAERQWHSLRARLGQTTVKLDELRDGHVLEFTFTPDRWPTKGQAPVVLADWLGNAVLDDQPVTVAQAQELVWIERIAGNEDLEETVRRRLDLYSGRAKRTADQVDTAASLTEELLEPVLTEIRDADPERLLAERAKLTEAESAERQSQSALRAEVERHERILNAIDARDRLQAASEGEEWQTRTAQLAGRLAELEREHPTLEQAIVEAATHVRRQGDVQEALAEAQRLQRYRHKRQRTLANDIARLGTTLGINPTRANVDREREDAQRRLSELDALRHAMDAVGSTARLIDRVSGVLDSGAAQGLGDQDLVARAEGNLSVEDVREGLQRRADELANTPPPGQLRDIIRDIQRARLRAARVNELIGRLRDAERQGELVDEADEEVSAAERRIEAAGGQDEALKEANRRLAAAEEEADRLAREQSELNAILGLEGGRSAQDATDDLQRALQDLELGNADELDQAEPRVRAAVGELERLAGAASDRAGALRRSVTLLAASIETTVATLLADERTKWLFAVKGVGDLLRDDSTSAETFRWLRLALLDIDERVQAARRLPETLSYVAANALGKRATESPLVGPVRELLGEELQQAFDRPAIRKYLFDGAELVHVDAFAQELQLRGADGQEDTRAFDTFSTGEQAFAFTQARVLELDPSPRPNRVLVLDEFGAFVAADRMPELANFLASDEVAAIADQVLVILPMQTEYERELEDTQGELHERYALRAEQISNRGYCAVPFEP